MGLIHIRIWDSSDDESLIHVSIRVEHEHWFIMSVTHIWIRDSVLTHCWLIVHSYISEWLIHIWISDSWVTHIWIRGSVLTYCWLIIHSYMNEWLIHVWISDSWVTRIWMRDSLLTNCWLIIATHCNTLQNTATHCNTLQHTATLVYEWETHYWLIVDS